MKKVCIGLILCFWVIIAYAAELSLHQQRSLFQTWLDTHQTLSQKEQKKQLSMLSDYPLYPYAKYQYFISHLDSVSINEINQFAKQYNDFPLVSSLMQSYVEQLTKQNEWQKITKLNIDKSLASRCRYQFALFKQGKKEAALAPIKNIWLSGDDLPSACDPIFDEWANAGNKTPNTILLRIELVLNNNNIKLARYLTEQLPDNYKTLKKNLLAVLDNPKKLADFSSNISASLFSKKIVMFTFPRLVNVDNNQAKSLVPTLIKQQKLNQNNKIDLLKIIANNYFKDTVTSEQVEWRDQFITENPSTSLVEKRIRLALKNNNLDNVDYWINLLPPEDKKKDEWLYLKSMILSKNNKIDEANKILQTLAQGRGFYAMYSAQRLNQRYSFDFDYPVIDSISPQTELMMLRDKYKNHPTIKRIEELRFWGMLPQAMQEWRCYLYSDSNSKQYAEIARYAYNEGWAEHSVQATIAGKLWNNWVERFPVVYQDVFKEFIQEKIIDLSYALAIARQESALDATVQSPAGAKGLMQIMSGTAKDSAKKLAVSDYKSTEQLYDPRMNIQLGTYYLDYVYQLFDNNRILASAAYNAGPNRVKRWLQDSKGQLDPITFIESIPFTETRNYVKSVLIYDYIYQLVLQNTPKTILKENELAYQY